MDTFSPFAIQASPAIGSMPPPSFAPPSLPPPLTNERPNETPPHHSSHHHSHNTSTSSSIHQADYKPPTNSSNTNVLSNQPSLSFSSMLALPTPLAQGPGTPLNLGSATADSHLQPTLQYVDVIIVSKTRNHFKNI